MAAKCSISPVIKNPSDRYKIEEIEAASDVVIWACDETTADFHPNRKNDRFFTGNIVQAIEAYATGKLGETTINTADVEHIVCIGSDRMMAAVSFRPPQPVETIFERQPHRHRLHQLADAMHDERNLRPMFTTPRRPGNRQGIFRLFLLQSGSETRFRRFQFPQRPPQTKRLTRKTDSAVDR